MTALVVRPALPVDQSDLRRLASLDSAAPLSGEVLLAWAGGELRAALSLSTGDAVADPFWPSADLVDVLRAAARPHAGARGPAHRSRLPKLKAASAATPAR
jgi:hypothetical protein